MALCRASAPPSAAATITKLGFHSAAPKPTFSIGTLSPTNIHPALQRVMIGTMGHRSKFHTHRLALLDEQDQVSFTEEENALIEALVGTQGRGRSASPQQLIEVESAVQVLEGLRGVPDPTSSSLIEGRWQLMFTTRPGTASPIQRTFVGVEFFGVIQEVYLRTNDPRVSNIVKFSDAIGELKVEAAASIKDGKRILFQFDRAAFSFKFLPFKVPYPVPFRLLGDEAKGWLDTTYLSPSGNLRISRGNKTETDSWLENAANGLMGKQVIKNGQIKYLVDILLGLKFSIVGSFVKSGTNSYDVNLDDAAIVGGGFGYPLELGSKFVLELLYSDDKIRITRGYNKIVFVHLRTDVSNQK
ncbi:Plastid lipid-associated protein/fibrillin conserved domain containing protein [Trema orientale]|uniref:Plastid lipid-associated protein/fibrillin conserved domain containing protein n=1 Tax=Trema orientale TaxID=63057 RepID=A0A2P5EEF3_TREOI|nr:Plastid lipid-associated protein/fibrillin conserved domain containing protein [Trema orientale]